MIDFLCEKGADIMSVNNHWTPLHVAFQTGNEATIQAVAKHVNQVKKSLQEQCPWNLEQDEQDIDFQADGRTPTPLEVGIVWSKMKTEALARAAEPNMQSFKTFIHRAPECIPGFAQRLQGLWSKEKLTEQLGRMTVEDLATLLNDFPQAAASVLEAATAEPAVASYGRHPLPARVSFACREWRMRFHMPCLCFYTPEVEWSYEDSCRKAPEWHSYLTEVRDKPMNDATIKVCHIPDIISPSFFSAVLDARTTHQQALFLFKCTPVRGAVWFTFWHGSMWVDIVQTVISTWGLCLLVFETLMAHEASVEADQAFVALNPSLANGQGIVADWIVAKGIVDAFLEAVQIVVCCRNDPASYCRWGNLWDLLRSFLPILLLWQHESRLLQCSIILIYWMRLLEGVSLSKQIGLALLPLKKLAYGLLPAMSFTILGFCAFSHAMCAVQVTPEHLWPHTFWYSFTTLITQGLPEHPPDDYLELMLLYGGVLFFSIFVMNIFIGVISEQYASEKEQGDVMFERVRAHSCLNYLTRISLLPCNLLTSRAAALLAFGVTALTLALQLQVLLYGSPMPGFCQLAALIVSQVVLFMASIQCKGKNYNWSEHDGGRRYLWICEPCEPSESKEPEPWSQVVEALERSLDAKLDNLQDEIMKRVQRALREQGRASPGAPSVS
eukprot:s1459_g5.t1